MNENMKKGVRVLPFFFVLLQSILYGFGDPISKIAYEEMPVYSLLTVRYLIAFVFLSLIGGRTLVTELKKTEIMVWFPSSLCIAGCYIVGNVALSFAAATAVAFLRSLSTVMTPVLATLLYRKHYDRKQIPIQLLVVIGLYLLCGYGGLSGFGLGEILSLLAAFFMSCALLFGQQAMNQLHPLTLTITQAGISAVFAAFCAVFTEGGIMCSGISPQVWMIILYLALACTAAGYLLQNAALKELPAKTVALLQCSCPVMTAVFSFFILREQLSAAGLIGSFLILCCILRSSLLSR